MFAIAVTDLDWFDHLRSHTTGRTVNFWTPTPWGVKELRAGDRLYFMLKAPVRKVGGYGAFSRYVDMSAAEAWAAYGLGNGVSSHSELVTKINSFAERRSKGLVSGPVTHTQTTRKDREGHSPFRQEVLRNYGYQCCMTKERITALLEAAHIQPYVDSRSNHPQNGLCLRVDVHRLFDEGLISITEQSTIAVSARLTGTSYQKLAGEHLRLPDQLAAHPSLIALEFHRKEVFRS